MLLVLASGRVATLMQAEFDKDMYHLFSLLPCVNALVVLLEAYNKHVERVELIPAEANPDKLFFN
jgi:hypothetical protein